MKSAEIRDAFLTFFASHGHTIVTSSSLVPGNDPTLLFTNAGMVQFKDVFLGVEKRDYNRAVSAQCCVRAGGKHNDLENVGYTARHHTFFEMLGNFSFGDYFKREAIVFAWDFLTQVLKLPEKRLWVTVHLSDDAAADIWLNEIGINKKRFSRLDEDNFWQMGETGPCGPCSEIFYDHGRDVPGGPPGSQNDDLDRYVEIWNLVFMQYERQKDGSLIPLPKPSVDTGMGLERIAAVKQGVHNNYEIDLFQNLVQAAAEATDTADLKHASLRVIADHIRSCAFLIGDGVMPANEGRGYVLRRIIRRAIRHGHKLGQKHAFFHKLAAPLALEMGDAYQALVQQQSRIESVLLAEEEQFEKTLDKGMAVLEQALAALEGAEIPGELVFRLYDTYGFPTDLTNDIARERNLTLDMAGYEASMNKQRARARAAGAFKVDYTATLNLEGKTDFLGYDHLVESGEVIALFDSEHAVECLNEGEQGIVVLDRTPFYAESGGQVGDSGYLSCADQSLFEVGDCRKEGDSHLHIGAVLKGRVNLGDKLRAQVDADVRQATVLNHSATHLLHAALRQVLGEHVEQKGSLVDSQRLRFDFSHLAAVKPEELMAIEKIVNEQIRANSEVKTDICTMEAAKAKGAIALFGEKYGSEVRVLSMGGNFSIELCGGTHVRCTGEIGLMRIVSESGIAAGVRRIEAVTATKALALFDRTQATVDAAATLIKANAENLTDKLQQLIARNRQMEKEIAMLKGKLASAASEDLVSQALDIDGIKVLAVNLDGIDVQALRDTADQLKNKMQPAIVLLSTVDGERISLVASVTKDLTARIKAGDLMQHVAPQLGGKGGGRADMAQGGGSNIPILASILASVPEWVKKQLSVSE